MSAIVEVWVSELVKLKEKVKTRKPRFLSKSKEGEAAQERMNSDKKETKVVYNSETTMSEDTVCLLMDRFAPW